MNLFSLQWKETFRAPQWEAKATIKILIGLVSLYLIGASSLRRVLSTLFSIKKYWTESLWKCSMEFFCLSFL